MTAIEWFHDQLEMILISANRHSPVPTALINVGKMRELASKAEKMEKEKEYQTQAFWYGRGIAAAKEDKIKEYAPKKPE